MQNKQRLSAITLGVLAASLLVSSVSFAANYKGEGNYKGEVMEPAPVAMPCLTLKDGFYVGLQGGYDSYRARLTNSETFTDTDGTLTVAGTSAASRTFDATGFVGGIDAGYGKYFNNAWYLGAEIFLNGSGASATSSFSDTETVTEGGVATVYSASAYEKVTVGTSYGISLLPGYKLNDSSLLYVRLGYNEARIKGEQSFSASGATTIGASKTNWQGGFNYGLGIETAVANNVSLRGEFTHTDYNSFTSARTKFKVSDNQFMLGLGYHFA